MRLLHWLPAALIAAAIFALSHQSHIPGGGAPWDYLGHAAEYAALGYALVWGFGGGWRTDRRTLLKSFAVLVLFAVSDEFHQSFVPGRTPEISDLLVDWISGFLAVTTAPRIFAGIRRKAGS